MRLRHLFSFMFFLFGAVGLLTACPNCKDALTVEGARALAEGYYWSILFMVSLPFVITGTVAFFIVRACRTRKKLIH